ncbi:hypothetical protein, partial [Bacillus subtilis]|uniref:hypothetical protein n=1 Tax=Bacillus subtilis TaxID=1423 RepID=UPI001BDB982D
STLSLSRILSFFLSLTVLLRPIKEQRADGIKNMMEMERKNTREDINIDKLPERFPIINGKKSTRPIHLK